MNWKLILFSALFVQSALSHSCTLEPDSSCECPPTQTAECTTSCPSGEVACTCQCQEECPAHDQCQQNDGNSVCKVCDSPCEECSTVDFGSCCLPGPCPRTGAPVCTCDLKSETVCLSQPPCPCDNNNCPCDFTTTLPNVPCKKICLSQPCCDCEVSCDDKGCLPEKQDTLSHCDCDLQSQLQNVDSCATTPDNQFYLPEQSFHYETDNHSPLYSPDYFRTCADKETFAPELTCPFNCLDGQGVLPFACPNKRCCTDQPPCAAKLLSPCSGDCVKPFCSFNLLPCSSKDTCTSQTCLDSSQKCESHSVCPCTPECPQTVTCSQSLSCPCQSVLPECHVKKVCFNQLCPCATQTCFRPVCSCEQSCCKAPCSVPSCPCMPVCPCRPCCCPKFVTGVRPVVEECIRHIPIVRNRIKQHHEFVTREIPIVQNHITHQEEQIVRHVPVVQKCLEPVMESRTRHVPVLRQKIRTVVEPFTEHVPLTENSIRQVEKCLIRQVPIFEKRCIPVALQTVHKIPVTERRCRPVVETQLTQVPVKQKVVKNILFQRLCTPCQCCPQAFCCPCCSQCGPCPLSPCSCNFPSFQPPCCAQNPCLPSNCAKQPCC
ncbi:keratin-associated protein 10-7-like [Cimex lectularius]|uniref:Uncharacterized protein n=1 Tax=Cimex lectularius TaxID=79782 RepID=A0A8I6S2C8_CIMLE|nr:keratin-associated protein 10-7-like [Cimex lectularius]